MTSLNNLLFLKDKLETPHVVSYFFNGLLRAEGSFKFSIGGKDREIRRERAVFA